MKWILVALGIALCSALAAAFARPQAYARYDRARSTRGFKNGPLNTARGFGKRSLQNELIPANWIADEIGSNPDLARLIVRRFVDFDQDGFVSPIELLRSPFSCQEQFAQDEPTD